MLRAAADVTDDELVVIGSQAVLAQYPDAPAALLTSLEVDLFPKDNPDRAVEVDGALGDGSRFHQTYGYYAHGVGPETAIAPAGWRDRLVPVRIEAALPTGRPVTAWCLEVHDLVLSKLAAGRPHDLEYAEEAITASLVNIEQLQLGIDLMPEHHREATRDRLEGALKKLNR